LFRRDTPSQTSDVNQSGPQSGATGDEGSETARPLPTSIKTFLICDIRGYTAYTTGHGDEAAARLAAQFAEHVEAIVREFDGRLLELRGDEALVVFTSARQAIRAGVTVQIRFGELATAGTFPLPLGVGIDAGEAVAVRDGFRGAALNLAARLCSLAAAGEVLTTPEVVHLASRVDGTRYMPYGTVRLKGLGGTVDVIKIEPEGDPMAAAAAVRKNRPSSRVGVQKRGRRRWRYAAAAGVVLVLATIITLDLFNTEQSGKPPTPDAAEEPLKATVLLEPDFTPRTNLAEYMIPSGKASPPTFPDDLRDAPAITRLGSPEYTQWNLEHGGVPYRSQTVRLVLSGTGETPVQITQLRAYIISREPSLRGWRFISECCGGSSIRYAEVSLDCPQQPATMVTPNGKNPERRTRQLDLQVSRTDVENFEVTAWTTSSYVRWGLMVRYVSPDREGWLEVTDPGMRVTGATPGSIRTYTYVYTRWAADTGQDSGLVRVPDADLRAELSFSRQRERRLCR